MFKVDRHGFEERLVRISRLEYEIHQGSATDDIDAGSIIFQGLCRRGELGRPHNAVIAISQCRPTAHNDGVTPMQRIGNGGVGHCNRVRPDGQDKFAGDRCEHVDVGVGDVDHAGLHEQHPAGLFTGHVDRSREYDGRSFLSARVDDDITAIDALLGHQGARTADVAAVRDEVDASADFRRAVGADRAFIVDGQGVDVAASGHQLGLHGLNGAGVMHSRAAEGLAGGPHGQVRVGRVDQTHILPSCHPHDAIGRVESAVVLDGGPDEVDVAFEGANLTVVDDAGPRGSGEIELAGIVHELGIGDVERGGHEGIDVNLPRRPDHDPVGVDQVHLAVGVEGTVNRRGVAADHAVQHGGVAVGHIEVGDFAVVDGEALPVDDGPLARRVDIQRASAGGNAGGTSDDHAALGVGHGGRAPQEHHPDLQQDNRPRHANGRFPIGMCTAHDNLDHAWRLILLRITVSGETVVMGGRLCNRDCRR